MEAVSWVAIIPGDTSKTRTPSCASDSVSRDSAAFAAQ
jgi:hypothetical protein